jgi:Spy/CpxP family protein refolding chaperone
MRPTTAGSVAAILVCAVVARSAVAQTGFPWWKDDKFVRELGLTPDQSAKIDVIFRANYPQLSQNREELDRQESELSRLISANADDAQVTRQIDKVELVRASLNKMRTLMLLNMVRVMTPEQRVRFNPIHEQWLRDHPQPPRTEPKAKTDSRP